MNTHRGWISVPLAAGSVYAFDQLASMIAAGSAAGGAYDLSAASPGLVASVTFPRAASLNQAVPASAGAPLYSWGGMIFRLTGVGSVQWTSDPVGTPGASSGIPLLGSDQKFVGFPGAVKDFKVFANSAVVLNCVFLQGDSLDF